MIGFIGAILLSVFIFICFYSIAPTIDGLNGLQLLSKGRYTNIEEKKCIIYMLSLETICIFFIPALILLFSIYQKPSLFGKCKIHSKGKFLFAIICIVIAELPGINLLSDINTKSLLYFLGEESDQWLQFLRAETLTNSLIPKELYVIDIVCMALIPAICEELFFRGFLQKIAISVFKNTHIAVIFTAFIFSILHGDIFNLIPRFVLGILLGYIFISSGNLCYSILAHALHNTIVVTCTAFVEQIPSTITEIGMLNNMPLLGLASIIILIGFIYKISIGEKTN